VLDMIGAKPTGEMDGKSLLPIVQEKRNTREEIFVETNQQRAILSRQWKLIRDVWGNKGLYNFRSDPMEAINMIDKEVSKREELEDTLNEWVKTNVPEGEADPMFTAAEQRKRATGEKEGWEMRPQV